MQKWWDSLCLSNKIALLTLLVAVVSLFITWSSNHITNQETVQSSRGNTVNQKTSGIDSPTINNTKGDVIFNKTSSTLEED